MNQIARLLSLCLLSLTWAVSAQATTFEKTLPNGLRIIVSPDHRAPVVVSQVWYKIGSANEPSGLTGISHVLEHMMFKGTPTHPKDEFSKIIAQNGGRENAMTSRDYTTYFQIIAAKRLPISMKLEADRMTHLNLRDDSFIEAFKKELEVVKEERRLRYDDKPVRVAYERFIATAHVAGPYHHLPIGWMEDLNTLTLSSVQKWYDTYYAPNNATLVVVGDVEPKAVFSLAEQTFGHLPKSKLPNTPIPKEPQPIGKRSIIVEAPAKLPHLIIGFNVPSLKSAANPVDAYALLVAANILAGSESARLPKDLVRKQRLANDVDVDYNLFAHYDTLFTLSALPKSTKEVRALKKALLTQIQKLITDPISDEELARVKNQLIANKVYARDSLFGQAMFIGQLAAVDLPLSLTDILPDKVNAITKQDIKDTLKKYFSSKRMTITYLKPLPLSKKQPRKHLKGGRHAH